MFSKIKKIWVSSHHPFIQLPTPCAVQELLGMGCLEPVPGSIGHEAGAHLGRDASPVLGIQTCWNWKSIMLPKDPHTTITQFSSFGVMGSETVGVLSPFRSPAKSSSAVFLLFKCKKKKVNFTAVLQMAPRDPARGSRHGIIPQPPPTTREGTFPT